LLNGELVSVFFVGFFFNFPAVIRWRNHDFGFSFELLYTKSVFMKKTFAIQTFAVDALLILLSYVVFLLVF